MLNKHDMLQPAADFIYCLKNRNQISLKSTKLYLKFLQRVKLTKNLAYIAHYEFRILLTYLKKQHPALNFKKLFTRHLIQQLSKFS